MVPGWLSHVTELWTHPAAARALRKLGDGHRFVWYDRLGCGLSDPPLEQPSLESDVDHLIAVLDDLEIDRCDLIGYSFGGPTAIAFAERHPERVRHLVLYSTYARGADLSDEAAYLALVDLVRSGWDLASVTLASVFVADGDRDDVRWFNRFQRHAASPTIAADLLLHGRAQDVTGLLGRVGVPTTVVTGGGDPVVPPVRAHELARAIPGARLVTLPGRSHDPFIRDDGAVAEAILAAVEGRPTTPVAPPRLPPVPELTGRETDVLRCLARGAANKEIAAELDISEATVERHLTNVYRKLGATGRSDALVRALGAGLVRLER
jgi:pimeloyl-ACP methyl ester carboxylesterase/DNA-binding CsgD family transcriptional regulator